MIETTEHKYFIIDDINSIDYDGESFDTLKEAKDRLTQLKNKYLENNQQEHLCIYEYTYTEITDNEGNWECTNYSTKKLVNN